ncbi:type II secretion system protein [bacterium]|nr:type II secretion system protein [bacterium]
MKRLTKAFTLAEGPHRTENRSYCHPELDSGSKKQMLKQVQHDKNKTCAFTLAEVLITLGVIGVVAAMTIPTLMANVKGKEYATKFKKEISVLNQMVRMNKSQYDWDFANTRAISDNYPCTASDNPEASTSICSIFNANLKGITFNNSYFVQQGDKPSKLRIDDEYPDDGEFYTIKLADYKSSTNYLLVDSSPYYILSDGALIAVPSNMYTGNCSIPTGMSLEQALVDVDMYLQNCVGFIDVNGPELPNTEISCSTGKTDNLNFKEPCTVKNNEIKDVYPILFYDSTVIPATNAAAYVLNNVK